MDTISSTVASPIRADGDENAWMPAPGLDVSLATYRRLRALIVTCRLAPGSPLIEADLADRLGASRTPIRAALARLVQEGFVIGLSPRWPPRPIVAPLTAGDVQEVCLMVGALEGVAAWLAAGLASGPRARLVRGIEPATRVLRAARAPRASMLVASRRAYLGFHRSLADAAAGPDLRDELDVLLDQVERYSRAYMPAFLFSTGVVAQELTRLVDSIRAGRADAAERQMRAHWRARACDFRQTVAQAGEQGVW